jgi:hypothetical protein
MGRNNMPGTFFRDPCVSLISSTVPSSHCGPNEHGVTRQAIGDLLEMSAAGR